MTMPYKLYTVNYSTANVRFEWENGKLQYSWSHFCVKIMLFHSHLFKIHICFQNILYIMMGKGAVLLEERGKGFIFTKEVLQLET